VATAAAADASTHRQVPRQPATPIANALSAIRRPPRGVGAVARRQ